VRPTWRGLRLRWPLFREILRVGAPGSLNTILTNLTVVLLTGLVGPFGATALAGYGLGARLEYLQIPIVFGLGSGLVTMVGTSMGAGHRARAQRVAWVGAAMAAGVTGTIGILAALFPHVWLGLFTSDPEVVAAGARYLRIVGPCYGFFGAGLALYFASQGAGRLLWPLLSAVVRLAIAAAGGWLATRWLGPASRAVRRDGARGGDGYHQRRGGPLRGGEGVRDHPADLRPPGAPSFRSPDCAMVREPAPRRAAGGPRAPAPAGAPRPATGLVFPAMRWAACPARLAAGAARAISPAGLLPSPRSWRCALRAACRDPAELALQSGRLLDLVNAFYQGLTHDVQLGAAYYIPTFIVPALVVTHVMMFGLLLRHPTSVHLDLPAS
jgi:hypothetical protein